MKERPILFSGEMVRAILEGRKTQTRRPITQNAECDYQGYNGEFVLEGGQWWFRSVHGCGEPIKCPFGVPGDRLWLRETMWISGGYVATDKPPYAHDGKVPSIHMRRCDSRLTPEVLDVRVQRLQDITEDDADAEGTWALCRCDEGCDICARGYIESFRDVWDSIYATRGFGWDTNPWVWGIKFKRVDDEN